MLRFILKGLMIWLPIFVFLVGCNQESSNSHTSEQTTTDIETVTVYKSQSCGCCKKWIDHLEVGGYKVMTQHPNDLLAVKERFGIAPNLRSCHTAVSSDGYVFEGHISIRYIQQFLANPPSDSIGLSVPAMPVGSPGMEFGNKFMPYQILLMKKDGTSEVFMQVDSKHQQYQLEEKQEMNP
ncbi:MULTISPECIES: DUF411 domain-containing protein [Kangiella]|uniref:Metal-binding protein n=1 Tax=Kangiella koreensis (strain DSM 16069 / JCM 12317 / KCTC 12182 / SW-125) TaxID=523791 RepID=C7RBS3_KANKD|nr:DUF411 domain-containing protein [Kangiella koreensis]ACV26715.1 protein of unknown function DUF411 [Kangiella koreensis DSM 16069]